MSPATRTTADTLSDKLPGGAFFLLHPPAAATKYPLTADEALRDLKVGP